MDNNEKKLAMILAEFAELAKIPRKSHHEAAVSDYLKRRAAALGLRVEQDPQYNIIIEKPAAPGYENAPQVILQAHMDMVCVAAEGVRYDPLTDPIKVKNDGKTLTAEGTSLGADDGVGVAMILYILQSRELRHGPLRAIITADEEDGMSGARQLDARYLSGRYLINIDSEEVDTVTVSSAGSVNVGLYGAPQWRKPALTRPYRIAATHLRGGHSGSDINRGRANAVCLVAAILADLRAAGVAMEIASIDGGMARNAIPANAAAVVVVGDADREALRDAVGRARAEFNAIYGAVEPDAVLECAPAAAPAAVLKPDIADGLVDCLNLLANGVHTMSQAIAGLVESSANLGVVKTTPEQIAVEYYPRSSVDAFFGHFRRAAAIVARRCGFRLDFGAPAPGWPAAKVCALAELMAAVYREQTGGELRRESIHAGLECGWFYQKNPRLELVSVGPTLRGVHSPAETLYLDTVVTNLNMIEETLRRLKAEL